ncbi:MAG: aminotransferase class V-fold PLP-dependent enzyme [Aquabacterium sp.]
MTTPPAAHPPTYGRHLLPLWWLDPDITYLNHGTVGATPRAVLAAQDQWRQRIERQPARALLRELVHLPHRPKPADDERATLRQAADALAAHLGARGDDLVFVDNATSGVNAVLRSLRFSPGDEIVLLDHGYGAMQRVAQHVGTLTGATIRIATLPYPAATPEGCVAALQAALTPRTRLALLDHITSESALVLPLQAMAAACRAAGVAVLADGAHAPGAIALDIPALGVDWYAANLHKWAFAPRGTGILWAAPQRQAGLHPPVISWGYGGRWDQEFDWTGTRDPSGWLAAPAGWAFMDSHLGGAQALRERNHALAWAAAQRLAARWDLAPAVPEAMVGTMAMMPLPARLGDDAAAARRLQDGLLFEQRIECPVLPRAGRLWLRISAQAYVDDADLAALERAIVGRLGAP